MPDKATITVRSVTAAALCIGVAVAGKLTLHAIILQ
jgi:hypothetical protein